MIKFDTDNNGIRFGNKTSFLEFVGIVIPLLLIPEKLRNQHIVFEVDNISCCFGLENRFLKEDSYTVHISIDKGSPLDFLLPGFYHTRGTQTEKFLGGGENGGQNVTRAYYRAQRH